MLSFATLELLDGQRIPISEDRRKAVGVRFLALVLILFELIDIPQNPCIIQARAESEKTALPACNQSLIQLLSNYN
ncbi:MAG: hypothetical protein NC548_51610 [Lachnospiraceae bacterium]|nr:hypothetical protein [Lachnospiraceae bacterium]